MNDLDVVVAVLKRAIAALETREPSLAPIEKMKLKALRLNLEAAQRAVSSTTPSRQPQDLNTDISHAATAPQGCA